MNKTDRAKRIIIENIKELRHSEITGILQDIMKKYKNKNKFINSNNYERI